jgi:hypothetical protein
MAKRKKAAARQAAETRPVLLDAKEFARALMEERRRDRAATALVSEFFGIGKRPAGPDDEQQPPAAPIDAMTEGMDDEDEKILRRMAQSPCRLFAIVDFQDVSNKTAGERVNAMIERGWANRPRGKNGGVQVTESGLKVAKQAGIIDRK